MRIAERKADATPYAFASFAALQRAERPVERVVLPIAGGSLFENDLLGLFLRHLRQVPNSRIETKILSAIQFTADSMNHGDALVSKTLVDLGLRAPREAFPAAFLDFADKSCARHCRDFSARPPSSIAALKEHWGRIGDRALTGWEDAFRYVHA